MPPRTGMGRGLDAILAVSKDASDGGELREVAVSAIEPNPSQPRRRFDAAALAALAGSLKARGVLQPVLLRPVAGHRYQLIAGERRWRAAKLAGMDVVPAIVRDRDDATTLEIALVENMAREDLSPVEQARACVALVEELGLTREQVGARVSRSRAAVSNLMRLLDLPDEALALMEDGRLSEGHGRALLLAEDGGDRRRLATEAAAAGWSVRAVEARARKANARRRGAGSPATLGAGAGSDTASVAEPGSDTPSERRAACAEIAALLERALEAEVTVRPRAGGRYIAELSFASLTEARAMAQRLAGGGV